ncbi:hypothetical protein ACWGQ5_34295 [Streptomyces sp. NPDC055722]
MICARCDKPIRDGQEYTTEANPGASAAGSDIHLHKQLCARPPAVARPRTYPPQDRHHY